MKKRKSSNSKDKRKVDLNYNLELGKVEEDLIEDSEYDFIPRFNHWLSLDEQKIKTSEIEKITKEKKE